MSSASTRRCGPSCPGVWRRRINPFAGRALSDKALTAEQDVPLRHAAAQAWRWRRASSRGSRSLVDGARSAAAPDEAFFQSRPASASPDRARMSASAAPRRLPFGDLPVILRVDHADALAGEGAPQSPKPADARRCRGRGALPGAWRRGCARSCRGDSATRSPRSPKIRKAPACPHVGVLVAQPVTATILGRPVDECPPDPRDDPYVDLQRIDGCRLALYLWPAEVVAIAGGPDYTPSRRRPGPAQPPRLHGVRHREAPARRRDAPMGGMGRAARRRRLRRATGSLDFVDRFAVARIGGTPKRADRRSSPRRRAAAVAGADRPVRRPSRRAVRASTSRRLRDAFVRMPPVGLLPPDLFDPMLRRQHFFPGGLRSVRRSRSPQAISSSRCARRRRCASFNRGVPDRVELLVPVPDSVYDPRAARASRWRIRASPRRSRPSARTGRSGCAAARRRGGATTGCWRASPAWSRAGRGADLPMEENSPAPRTQVPVEISRTRRFTEQTAARTHVMVGAQATLPVAKATRSGSGSRSIRQRGMTGLSLRLGDGHRAGDQRRTSSAPACSGAQPDVLPIGRRGQGLAGAAPATCPSRRCLAPDRSARRARSGDSNGGNPRRISDQRASSSPSAAATSNGARSARPTPTATTTPTSATMRRPGRP